MGDVFKALSDPTRRKILELLREHELSAGEIAEAFNISKPSISHHLAILKFYLLLKRYFYILLFYFLNPLSYM